MVMKHVCIPFSLKYINTTSMARTGLGPLKLVLAKGSSSHPGWIMHKMILRDHDDSSSQLIRMSDRARTIEVPLYM